MSGCTSGNTRQMLQNCKRMLYHGCTMGQNLQRQQPQMTGNVKYIKRKALVYVNELGQGAFSTVYHMTWKSPNGPINVAAKRLNRKDEHELQVLSSLNHLNIVKLIGVVDEETDFMLILEFCDNGSLRSYLSAHNGRCLSEKQFYDWAEQSARPLEYLQENKWIHKDVKSPNYMVTSQNTLKLGDFGLAKNIDQTIIGNATETASYRWMAPELLVENNLSPKYDIFALAVVLWELWTGSFPWEGVESHTVVYKVCYENERLPVPGDCPVPMQDLLRQCWQTEWKQRPDIIQVLEVITTLSATALEARQKQIIDGPWEKVKVFGKKGGSGKLDDFGQGDDFGQEDETGELSGTSHMSHKMPTLSAEILEHRQKQIIARPRNRVKEFGKKNESGKLDKFGQKDGKGELCKASQISCKIPTLSAALLEDRQKKQIIAGPWNMVKEFGKKDESGKLDEFGQEDEQGELSEASHMSREMPTLSAAPLEDRQKHIIVGPWNMLKGFGKKGGSGKLDELGQEVGSADLCEASHMTFSGDGDVVIADKGTSQIKVYSLEGILKFSIDTLRKPAQIAVSSDNTCFLTDYSKRITMYDLGGKYKGSWKSACHDASSHAPRLHGISIDHTGYLLLGDCENKYIYRYTKDGTYVASIKVSLKPWYIAVTSRGTIVIGGWAPSPQVITNTGQVLHTLRHPRELQWNTWNVYCHLENIIFVCSPVSILCYSESGTYLGSMPLPPVYPCGLAKTLDSKTLLVCAKTSVQVFTSGRGVVEFTLSESESESKTLASVLEYETKSLASDSIFKKESLASTSEPNTELLVFKKFKTKSSASTSKSKTTFYECKPKSRKKSLASKFK